MTAISDCFKNLSRNSECALIPFITAGDPSLETTAQALQVLDRSGADIIELGVPYSDPLADGPVIQAAATRALQKGTKFDSILEMVKATIPSLLSPIILFTYYNPILYRGIEKFLTQIASSGVAGLVVPDLPLEEAQGLLQPASMMGIDVTLLVAPTSSTQRIEASDRSSQGFIYLGARHQRYGNARSAPKSRVSDLLKQIRGVTDTLARCWLWYFPARTSTLMCASWGADAAIVGSAFVKRLAFVNSEQGLKAIARSDRQTLKQSLQTSDN
jgi:tryptophan synthase alpha chain